MYQNQTSQTGFRLAALDLDGTVLTSDKRLTAHTREMLLFAADKGVEIVLVTGRPLSGLPEELVTMPQIRYAITSNGAVTYDLASGKKLRTAFLNSDAALQLLSFPIQRHLLFNVFIDGMGYCSQEVYQILTDRFDGTPLETYVRSSRRSTPHLMDFIREHGEIENIWIQAGSRPERDELYELFCQEDNIQMVLTANTDLEIGVPAADKGLALTELAQTLQISREEILSFGDNYNDLGMFRACGTSVAMGNAPEEIRQMTTLTTDTNDRDGVAKMLARLL